MRKKVDQRIRTLVENGVKLRQRSLFVIVGDRGRDQASGCVRRRVSNIALPAMRASLTWFAPPMVPQIAGCQPALHALEGERESAPKRSVVLQEGSLPQQPPQEAHEAGALGLL